LDVAREEFDKRLQDQLLYIFSIFIVAKKSAAINAMMLIDVFLLAGFK
jgi:hypothetical protein